MVTQKIPIYEIVLYVIHKAFLYVIWNDILISPFELHDQVMTLLFVYGTGIEYH